MSEGRPGWSGTCPCRQLLLQEPMTPASLCHSSWSLVVTAGGLCWRWQAEAALTRAQPPVAPVEPSIGRLEKLCLLWGLGRVVVRR